MALCGKVVDFIGVDLFKEPVQIARVDHIPIVKEHPRSVNCRIVEQMVDSSRIERTAPPNDAMNNILAFEQELRQIRTILTCNSRDKGCFLCRHYTVKFLPVSR